MASECISKGQLCERCASWDLDHLFKGEVDDAYRFGPLKDKRHKRTWDRVPFDGVRGNTCPLCQFINQVVTTSSAWDEISQTILDLDKQLYLNFQKEEFCLVNDRANYKKEKVTTLALQLQDNWDPRKSSPALSNLDYPSLQCYQFRPPQDGQEPRQRLAVRRLGSQIDFDLVQQWVKSCNRHGEPCFKQTGITGIAGIGSSVSRYSRIRLIDIKKRRLVWLDTKKVYAALSYVWGPPDLEQARLTKGTQAALFLDGALTDNNETIPRTIRDAMTVCERLGIPHLWVDALCIEQDSSDFDVHLQKMNDIYAAAYLTIVSACGADSWNGLSGLAPGSRKVYQPSIIIGDMEIGLAVPEFWTSVMQSPWASRGWTFQERLFSRRMLIFAERQCFFYCDKLTRIESTTTEADGDDGSIEHRFLYPHLWVDDRQKLFPEKNELALRPPLLDYFQLFCNHRRLSLTYQTDVLRALGGVTATYEQRLSSSSYFGMPTSVFTYALLLDRTICNRRPNFPSWSWAGWSSDREDLVYSSQVCNTETATVFYRLHPTLNLESKQDQWIFTAIDDRETQGAAEARRGIDPVLYYQNVHEHLNRQDLEQLLIFETQWSTNDLYSRTLDYFQAMDGLDLYGEDFDREHNMTFASIQMGSLLPLSAGLTPFPPYISQSMFLQSRAFSFALIATGSYRGRRTVWLMVVRTDEKGISTKLSFCVIYEDSWLASNRNWGRVYLM